MPSRARRDNFSRGGKWYCPLKLTVILYSPSHLRSKYHSTESRISLRSNITRRKANFTIISLRSHLPARSELDGRHRRPAPFGLWAAGAWMESRRHKLAQNKKKLSCSKEQLSFFLFWAGFEPTTFGLWEIQNLCVRVLFCWVWWYCVPRLRMGFVPCVQKGAIRCWPVPSPFGGSFGGKSARQILIRTDQINAQLWFHWEMWIPISLGSRKWKAQQTNI